MNTRLLFASLATLSVCLLGCPNDPTESDELPTRGEAYAGSAQSAQLDLTSGEWVYFSFENGVVTPPTPDDSAEWDIAFQRYNVKTNGGTSGTGNAASADLGDLSLETTERATVNGWTEDGSIEDARTGEKQSMNGVLSGWYDYDFNSHELSSKQRLYAVKDARGEQIAFLNIADYYDDAGVAGYLTLNYRFPMDADVGDGEGWVDPAACEPADTLDDVITEEGGVVYGETNLDASQGAVFFSFANEGAVNVEGDWKKSDAWDLSFDLWLLRSNSGTSHEARPGQEGGALQAGTRDFDAATEAPETGWLVDTMQTIGAEQRLESTNSAFAGWWELDSSTQRIRSFEDVYWIRDPEGRFAKLQILSYYHPGTCKQGFYRLRWAYRPDGGRDF